MALWFQGRPTVKFSVTLKGGLRGKTGGLYKFMNPQYQAAIDNLLDATGKVETVINSLPGNNPTGRQSFFLALLQGGIKDQIMIAKGDPDLATQDPPTP